MSNEIFTNTPNSEIIIDEMITILKIKENGELKNGVTLTVDNQDFHLGYSRISKYIECPKSFKYSYIDGIRSKANAAMNRGTAYHGALEDMFNYRLEHNNELMPLEQAERCAIKQSRKVKLTDAQIYNVIDAVRYFYKMKYEGHVPAISNTNIEPLSVNTQKSVEGAFEIFRGGVKITGRIDLATKDGIIVDHKFSNDTWSEARAKYGVQPIIYQWAGIDWLEKNFDVPEYSGFQYNIIKIWPQVDIQVVHIPRVSQEKSDWWEEQVASVAKAIKAGVFTATPSDRICQWCGHKKLCKPVIYDVDINTTSGKESEWE